MKLLAMLIVIFGTLGDFAQESATVQQFKLTDGRVLQAVRLIKIGTPRRTTYLITLADGTKVSFTGEDVFEISDASLPVAILPPSLNVEQKQVIVVKVAPQAPEAPPVEYVEGPPIAYPEAPQGYVYQPHIYRPNDGHSHHHVPPPPAPPPA